MNRKFQVSMLFAFALFTNIKGQYTLNSPYSRFNLGDLEPQGFVVNRSMGGAGVALRMPNLINSINPASYTTQDTLSFIWDVAMKGNFINYQTSSQSLKQRNFNFDHLAFSACMSKYIYLSAGLIPYSKTGYNYIDLYQFPDSEIIKNEYVGTGNINRFYFGNAYSLFNRRISVGYNVSYLFGQIKNQTYINFINSAGEDYGYYTVNTQDLSISGWLFTLGVQWQIPISNRANITLGATYEPQTKLSANKISILNRSNDTLSYKQDTGKYVIPGRLAFGLGLQINDNFTFVADYTMQKWSKADFFGKNDSLRDSRRVSLGMEYVRNKFSYTSYLARIRFRLGVYYDNTYLNIKNTGIDDYGISVGLGLPLKRSNSLINIGYEMGRRGTTKNQLIQDNYQRVYISLSLYDFWFYKRKYD